MRIRYAKLLLALAVFCSAGWLLLDRMAGTYVARVDRLSRQAFLANEGWYSPMENGLPQEVNLVYADCRSFSDRKNLILLGASTTRDGVLTDRLALPSPWKTTNLGIGWATVESFELMFQFLKRFANHAPDKSDLVAVHIWYPSFAPSEPKKLKQVIELIDLFTVHPDLTVTGSWTRMDRDFRLSQCRIRFALGLALGLSEIISPAPGVLLRLFQALRKGTPSGPVKHDFEAYQKYWRDEVKGVRFPGPSTERFCQLLKRLKQETNVVVVNLYAPSWHRKYPEFVAFKTWFEGELVPFLAREKIPCLDFNAAISDDHFGDSAHLLLSGRQRFTEVFRAAILPLLP